MRHVSVEMPERDARVVKKQMGIMNMRRIITSIILLAAVTAIQAVTITITVYDTRCQTITGFGAACCDGAM